MVVDYLGLLGLKLLGSYQQEVLGFIPLEFFVHIIS